MAQQSEYFVLQGSGHDCGTLLTHMAKSSWKPILLTTDVKDHKVYLTVILERMMVHEPPVS
jgi:hypothetical protein